MTALCAALCFLSGYAFCWALTEHKMWFRVVLFLVAIAGAFLGALALRAGV
jgi:ABC-type spermidine/putrescine transport system permease subunit I